MTAPFTHLEPGTGEQTWRDDPGIRSAPALDVEISHLVVVAAHPDDETLGAGGLIGRVAAMGRPVSVVVITDGEASHPASPTRSPAQLARIRRAEVREAVRALAPSAEVEFLGIPDGRLREHADRLTALLTDTMTETVGSPATALVVSPWSGDGHRDHRIAAECVASACAQHGIRHLAYPIWLWHWGMPADVPWELAHGLALTPDEVAAKRRAMARHVSQVQPLSPAPGDEAIIHEAMSAHFEREVEVYFDERG